MLSLLLALVITTSCVTSHQDRCLEITINNGDFIGLETSDTMESVNYSVDAVAYKKCLSDLKKARDERKARLKANILELFEY